MAKHPRKILEIRALFYFHTHWEIDNPSKIGLTFLLCSGLSPTYTLNWIQSLIVKDYNEVKRRLVILNPRRVWRQQSDCISKRLNRSDTNSGTLHRQWHK